MNQGINGTENGGRKIHAVIVGAGVSGMRAAFDLAELGHDVVLLDKAPFTGGILSRLDHQFPDNHCGMCQILPMIDRDKGVQVCLRKGVFHDHITFMPQTEVISVDGTPGRLNVRVSEKGSGIDSSLCTGCGICEDVCPVIVKDDFNENYSERKAVYLGDPHQDGSMRVIDFTKCTRCGECVTACPEKAVDLDRPDKEIIIENVGSVIVATGTGQYDPSVSDLYGFGVFENVVTSQGLERIISSSGPFKGKFLRPSDKKPVESIAWIQCVGSRNLAENADYCSSVCCMFALKEAVLAREKSERSVKTTIFYMDMRTFGRDFQRYRDDAENVHGVNLVRCRVHSVEPGEKEGDLKLSYVDMKGVGREETFDLVVLSTGRKHGLVSPEYASRDGVFTMNASFEFKDIAESIIAADVAAGKSLAFVSKHESDSRDIAEGRSVVSNALVIGSGPAGLSAALTLAEAGVTVDIVEKQNKSGGNGFHITTSPEKERFSRLLSAVENHGAISLHLNARVLYHRGLPGAFAGELVFTDGRDEPARTLTYGGVVIASGGGKKTVTDYSAGQHDSIVTVYDLDKKIHDGNLDKSALKEVVFIQCAGSREEPLNYCSRVCCAKALACAVKLLESDPALKVRFFYRDIMSYGESEKLYTQARKLGALFTAFDLSSKPTVSVEKGAVTVSGFDHVMQEEVSFSPSLLVLSTGIVPSGTKDIRDVFPVDVTQDGFLKEANSKWRPVDSGKEGIFVCGIGRAPMKAGEAMDEGIAAAMRALRILLRKSLPVPKVLAIVRHTLCSRCYSCIPECPYEARYIDYESGRVMVDETSCQGCGACASICPNSSVYTGTFEDPEVMREIEEFL